MTSSMSAKSGRQPHLALLVSSGWAVRNYLRTGFLEALQAEMEITVLLPEGDPTLRDELADRNLNVEWLRMTDLDVRQNVVNGLLVDATNDRLHFNSTYLAKRTDAYLSGPTKAYARARRLAGRALGRSPLYQPARQLERRWLYESESVTYYRKWLENASPDLVLCTNPYSWHEIPLCLASSEKNIPTIGAIVSWDNLCYKGHVIPEFSHFIVWGGMMVAHLRRHFPDLDEDSVLTAGAPQFDFHMRNDLIWSRDEFCSRIGADSSRPLLTYSASTSRVLPDEPEVVRLLWERIRDGSIYGKPQLLIRLHPIDRKPERFAGLAELGRDVILMEPWKRHDPRLWWFTPTEEEIALLSNTLRYSDVNINVASSVTLDAAILDTPVVNVAFTTRPSDSHCLPVAFAHRGSDSYRQVVDGGAARVARSIDELVAEINRYLTDPESDRRERREVVEWVCGPVDGNSHLRIATFVLDLALDGLTEAATNHA